MKKNIITLEGYVFDPEVRKTNGGRTVLQFDLSFNSKKDEVSGEWNSDFIRVSVFDPEIELKGKEEVQIVGFLVIDKFTKKDGTKVKLPKIIVNSISVIERLADRPPEY